MKQLRWDRVQLPISLEDRPGLISQRETAEGAKQGSLCLAVVPDLCGSEPETLKAAASSSVESALCARQLLVQGSVTVDQALALWGL